MTPTALANSPTTPQPQPERPRLADGLASPAAECRGVRGKWSAAGTTKELRRLRAELNTERAARDKADRAKAMKDECMTTLAHELRTSLQVIMNWTDLLKRGRLSPAQCRDALGIIDRSALVLSRMVDDVLDLRRALCGKLELELRDTVLRELAGHALESVRPAAQLKSIALTATVPGGITLQADPARLQQVLWNLLTNAIKFTDEGGRIELSAERAGDCVDIEVRDTGQGTSQEFLPRLFYRFNQADPLACSRQRGLGLGLALVREIVELHGGTVSASSPGPGRGATFVVRLPVRPDAALAEHDSASCSTSQNRQHGRRQRVRVVETGARLIPVTRSDLEGLGAKPGRFAPESRQRRTRGRT